MAREGAKIIVQSNRGVQYSRNVADAKRVEEHEDYNQQNQDIIVSSQSKIGKMLKFQLKWVLIIFFHSWTATQCSSNAKIDGYGTFPDLVSQNQEAQSVVHQSQSFGKIIKWHWSKYLYLYARYSLGGGSFETDGARLQLDNGNSITQRPQRDKKMPNRLKDMILYHIFD